MSLLSSRFNSKNLIESLLNNTDFELLPLDEINEIVYYLALLGYDNNKLIQTLIWKLNTDLEKEKAINLLWTLIFFDYNNNSILKKIIDKIEDFIINEYSFLNEKINTEISEIFAIIMNENRYQYIRLN